MRLGDNLLTHSNVGGVSNGRTETAFRTPCENRVRRLKCALLWAPVAERTAPVHEVIERGSRNICRCCVADWLTCLWLELPARMFDRAVCADRRWEAGTVIERSPLRHRTGRLIATPACLHQDGMFQDLNSAKTQGENGCLSGSLKWLKRRPPRAPGRFVAAGRSRGLSNLNGATGRQSSILRPSANRLVCSFAAPSSVQARLTRL